MRIVEFMENATNIVPWISKGLHFDHPGDCFQHYVCLSSESVG